MSLEQVMGEIAAQGDPVSPGCYYTRDGDSIHVHLEDVPYTARVVSPTLAVYLAEDGRVVGIMIQDVGGLIGSSPE